MCSVNVSVSSSRPHSFTRGGSTNSRGVFFSLLFLLLLFFGAEELQQVSEAVREPFDQTDAPPRLPCPRQSLNTCSLHLNDPQCRGGVEYPS